VRDHNPKFNWCYGQKIANHSAEWSKTTIRSNRCISLRCHIHWIGSTGTLFAKMLNLVDVCKACFIRLKARLTFSCDNVITPYNYNCCFRITLCLSLFLRDDKLAVAAKSEFASFRDDRCGWNFCPRSTTAVVVRPHSLSIERRNLY